MMPMPANMPVITDAQHIECALAMMHLGMLAPLSFMTITVDWPRAHYRQDDSGNWRFVGQSPKGERMYFHGKQ